MTTERATDKATGYGHWLTVDIRHRVEGTRGGILYLIRNPGAMAPADVVRAARPQITEDMDAIGYDVLGIHHHKTELYVPGDMPTTTKEDTP